MLGPEILDLAKKKIEAKTKEKNDRIISLMKKFYEIQCKYSLIIEKYNLLTNEIIYDLSTSELRDAIYYFAKGDDTAIPARNIDIIQRAKDACRRISSSIETYLKSKGVKENDITTIDAFLSGEKLIAEFKENTADERYKLDLDRCRKLLMCIRKIVLLLTM